MVKKHHFKGIQYDCVYCKMLQLIKQITTRTPLLTKDTKIVTQTIQLSTLIERLKHDEIDLQPGFQRKSGLWTHAQMSRLIESVLLKMPLPLFYFDVANPDKWLVVDGLQRLSTIKRFVVDSQNSKTEASLKLTEMEFLTELNGLTYQDLPRPLQRVIDETPIITCQIEAQTPKEIRYSIFNRINTGGLSLHAQEIRHGLNQKGIAIEFLKAQCHTPEFLRVVDIQSDRMQDRELALRFFAFRLLEVDESFTDLPSFLNRAMEKIDEQQTLTPELESLSYQFGQSLAFSEHLLGAGHTFSRAIAGKGKKVLNRSLFDVLTVCLSQVEDKEHLQRHAQLFKKKLIEMLSDEQSTFSQALMQEIDTKHAVINQFDEMRKLISEIENIT
jgi:hypothetical protein